MGGFWACFGLFWLAGPGLGRCQAWWAGVGRAWWVCFGRAWWAYFGLAWWAGFGLAWWAGFGLGVCAAKNLRKHARAALACLTSFCGHAPFCNFFIAHPLPQSLQGVAGAPLKTEYRRLNTEAQRLNIQKPERANTANPWRSGNGAAELFWHVLGAKYDASQHAVCASSY